MKSPKERTGILGGQQRASGGTALPGRGTGRMEEGEDIEEK